MTYDPTQPQRLHSTYCKMTGLNIPWGTDRMWPWELFALKFTEDDLVTVIKFIMNKQRKGQPARSLNFRNLIAGPDSLTFFQEDLCEARAQPKYAPRDKVLVQSGRPKMIENTARSAAQILAGEQALKELIRLRDTL